MTNVQQQYSLTSEPADEQVHVRSGRANRRSSLKVAIPIRRNRNTSKSKLDTSGCFATLLYSFLTPLFKKSFRGNLTEKEVLKLRSSRESADVNYKRLMRLWQEELDTHDPEHVSFNRVMFRFIRTRVLVGACVMGIGLSCGNLVTAYLFYRIVSYLESAEFSLKLGMSLVVGLFIAASCKIFFNNFSWFVNLRAATRLRSALLLAVYRKITRIRGNADVTVGEIVNLCVNDLHRLREAVYLSAALGSMPFIAVILVACLLIVLGPSALAGVATTFIFFAVTMIMVRQITRIRQDCVKTTDQRIRLMTELLTCMKFIKMYAWEEAFAKRISDVRKEEESFLLKTNALQGFSFVSVASMGATGTLMSIVTYTSSGNELTAAQAFTTLMLFSSFTTILFVLPAALKQLAETVVVGRRIQKYLQLGECTRRWDTPEDASHAIVITDATMYWSLPTQQYLGDDKPDHNQIASNGGTAENKRDMHSNQELKMGLLADSKPQDRKMPVCLRKINIAFEKGKLIGICGNVGSGKTSLLSAILGENHLLTGNIYTNGTIAYVSQQAWIMNATVKENILFGAKFDQTKYESILFACSLQHDLDLMDHGDETEIGERGINLSGGQKQRISMARAMYSGRDIYLLDDPLSAVDIHVGHHIFTHCIKDSLAGKTVLFVTHQLQYLRDCDMVILIQDGCIAEQGTHEELITKAGDYARLINEFHPKEQTEGRTSAESMLVTPNDVKETEEYMTNSSKFVTRSNCQIDETVNARLIEEETRGSGVVSWETYREFIRYSGGTCVFLLVIFLVFVGTVAMFLANIWLGIWLRSAALEAHSGSNVTATLADVNITSSLSQVPYGDVERTRAIQLNERLPLYLGIYASVLVFGLLIGFGTCFIFIKVMLTAANNLHYAIFRRILRSPMSFFDTTPLGRILNRFSNDLDLLDNKLCENVRKTILCLSGSVITQLLVCVTIPWYIPASVVFLGLLFSGFYFYRRGVSDFRRMENTSLSLLLSHITATMQGLATVTAFDQISRFTKRFEELLNTNAHFDEVHTMGPRWMAVRTDCLGAFCTFIIGSLVIVFKGNIAAPIAALLLFYGVRASVGGLQGLILGLTESESLFISVERILEYIKILKPEAPNYIEETAPPKDWPSEGSLTYNDVQMKYRENMPLILKNVSFRVEPRERIGIVGRTGAGKSSLGVSLFRLVELDSGSITIDDHLTSNLGLHQLRSKISIIPQDPVLFTGSVRYNLDPFEEHEDIELWAALEKAHMKSTISDLDGQLEAEIEENGDNFSVGERQLICMARALLRNSKILLLDEATAAIDTKTDSLIQKAIRQAFTQSTMLIIAHRLNTVLDCDRILLMDNGEVAEYDEPKILLDNPSSKFSQMLHSQ